MWIISYLNFQILGRIRFEISGEKIFEQFGLDSIENLQNLIINISLWYQSNRIRHASREWIVAIVAKNGATFSKDSALKIFNKAHRWQIRFRPFHLITFETEQKYEIYKYADKT